MQKLIINLNISERIKKKNDMTYKLEVKIDGVSVGFITESSFFYVENGPRAIHLEFGAGTNYWNTRYNASQCLVENADVVYTVNVYGWENYDGGVKIEFFKGDVPYDSTKEVAGCYVATCVYGSYDCPQVWTLRRFRDNTLGATWYGRLFIRVYYAVSPTLVRWFGKTNWFQKFWKGKLDRMVKKLQEKGVEDTPYQDLDW